MNFRRNVILWLLILIATATMGQKGQQEIELNLNLANDAISIGDYSLSFQHASAALEESYKFENSSGLISSSLLMSKIFRLQKEFAKALDYAMISIKEAEERGEESLIQVYTEVGQLYKDWEVNQKALGYFNAALTRNPKDKNLRASIINNMADCYLNLNDFRNAAINYMRVYELRKNNGTTVELITILRDLQDAYLLTNKYEEALKYNLIILDLKIEINDSTGIGNSLNNIGYLYKHLNKNEEALQYFMESLELNRKLNPFDYPHESEKSILMNIGVIYSVMTQYKRSTQYYLEALKIWKEYATAADLAEIYFGMASNYVKLKSFNIAALHSEAAIAYAIRDNQLDLLALLYKQMSEIHRKAGENEKALIYYQLYAEVNDELISQQKLQQQEAMKKQFEIEKRESDLRLIMAEKEMKELEVKKLELETEKHEQDIAFLLQEKQLQELKIRNQVNEREKTEQELLMTQQQLDAQIKDREIAMLHISDSVKSLQIKQSELEVKERQGYIKLLDQQRANQELKLEEQILMQRFYVGALILISIILFLILRSYFLNRKINRQLARQNREIQYQKDKVETALNQLKAAQSQLVQSEKMASLGQLTAGIAHEINNPINFVSAGVDGLRSSIDRLMNVIEKYNEIEQTESLKQRETLLDEIKQIKKEVHFEKTTSGLFKVIDAVKDGASRTVEIVNGLRNFSRTDEYIPKFANINKSLEGTLVIIKNEAVGKGISIVKNFDTTMPEIKCYPGKLNQVFMNIISNSIQAIQGNGIITITTKNLKDIVKISIKDTGVGMSEKVKSKIFDPFFTTKDVGNGTGLGLSISYGIIQNHKGKLMAYSTPGKGSEFVIFLPKYDFQKNLKAVPIKAGISSV